MKNNIIAGMLSLLTCQVTYKIFIIGVGGAIYQLMRILLQGRIILRKGAILYR